MQRQLTVVEGEDSSSTFLPPEALQSEDEEGDDATATAAAAATGVQVLPEFEISDIEVETDVILWEGKKHRMRHRFPEKNGFQPHYGKTRFKVALAKSEGCCSGCDGYP